MSHITTTSTTAKPPSTVQPRLQRLVQAFGQHADWQNVFRFALGQLQNDQRDVEKQRLALWLLEAGNPYLVLDAINTDNLVLDPMLNRLTRWLVHLDYTGSTDFSNEWKPEDKRPELHEFVFENVRVANVVTSLLHRDNRDSRVLISAWELLKSADITKSLKLQAARTAFLSEFRTLAGLPPFNPNPNASGDDIRHGRVGGLLHQRLRIKQIGPSVLLFFPLAGEIPLKPPQQPHQPPRQVLHPPRQLQPIGRQAIEHQKRIPRLQQPQRQLPLLLLAFGIVLQLSQRQPPNILPIGMPSKRADQSFEPRFRVHDGGHVVSSRCVASSSTVRGGPASKMLGAAGTRNSE